MFRAVPCSSSGGHIVLLQPPLSTDILYGLLQRVTIPDSVKIKFVLLKMSKVLLETC